MSRETNIFLRDQEPYDNYQYYLGLVCIEDDVNEIIDLVEDGNEHSAFEKFSGSPALDAIAEEIVKGDQ